MYFVVSFLWLVLTLCSQQWSVLHDPRFPGHGVNHITTTAPFRTRGHHSNEHSLKDSIDKAMIAVLKWDFENPNSNLIELIFTLSSLGPLAESEFCSTIRDFNSCFVCLQDQLLILRNSLEDLKTVLTTSKDHMDIPEFLNFCFKSKILDQTHQWLACETIKYLVTVSQGSALLDTWTRSKMDALSAYFPLIQEIESWLVSFLEMLVAMDVSIDDVKKWLSSSDFSLAPMSSRSRSTEKIVSRLFDKINSCSVKNHVPLLISSVLELSTAVIQLYHILQKSTCLYIQLQNISLVLDLHKCMYFFSELSAEDAKKVCTEISALFGIEESPSGNEAAVDTTVQLRSFSDFKENLAIISMNPSPLLTDDEALSIIWALITYDKKTFRSLTSFHSSLLSFSKSTYFVYCVGELCSMLSHYDPKDIPSVIEAIVPDLIDIYPTCLPILLTSCLDGYMKQLKILSDHHLIVFAILENMFNQSSATKLNSEELEKLSLVLYCVTYHFPRCKNYVSAVFNFISVFARFQTNVESIRLWISAHSLIRPDQKVKVQLDMEKLGSHFERLCQYDNLHELSEILLDILIRLISVDTVSSIDVPVELISLHFKFGSNEQLFTCLSSFVGALRGIDEFGLARVYEYLVNQFNSLCGTDMQIPENIQAKILKGRDLENLKPKDPVDGHPNSASIESNSLKKKSIWEKTTTPGFLPVRRKLDFGSSPVNQETSALGHAADTSSEMSCEISFQHSFGYGMQTNGSSEFSNDPNASRQPGYEISNDPLSDSPQSYEEPKTDQFPETVENASTFDELTKSLNNLSIGESDLIRDTLADLIDKYMEIVEDSAGLVKWFDSLSSTPIITEAILNSCDLLDIEPLAFEIVLFPLVAKFKEIKSSYLINAFQ